MGFATRNDMLTSDAPDNTVRMACDNAGIKMFEVTEGFRRHIDENGLYSELDGHFTPAGSKLLAEFVTPAYIKEIGDKAKKR
ncbi:MAG: hypothetical protein NTU83_10515 [Candidatus Hydrogenedentes bacterium]|nr:hypothetical protein [Candidatus Hydrogenedentota bacterium]